MNENGNGYDGQDTGVISWICTADGLLGGLILMLIVALSVAGNLSRAETQNKNLEEKLAEAEKALSELKALRGKSDGQALAQHDPHRGVHGVDKDPQNIA